MDDIFDLKLLSCCDIILPVKEPAAVLKPVPRSFYYTFCLIDKPIIIWYSIVIRKRCQ